MADHVEENPQHPQPQESAEQSRQSQKQQVDKMTPVGADERPRAHREAKDVARAELAWLRKRNLSGRRRCDDRC